MIARIRVRIAIATAAGAAFVIASGLVALARTHVTDDLTATVHAPPSARGRAKLALKTSSRGKFKVVARRLHGSTSYDVVIGGVKVGTLTTNPGGGGKLGLSTSPKGKDGMLGVDPRGDRIEVRDPNGDDELEGEMPNDDDPNAVGCCIAEHDDEAQVECERMTPDECMHEGGTPSGSSSCIPDSCGSDGEQQVVCCSTDSEDDDPNVECAMESAHECGDHDGQAVQATSCDPNPCTPVPPPALVVCCVPEDDGVTECEHLTPDHCSEHGTPSSATSCDPNSCGSSSGGDDPNNHD
jgi:hypothetical protein